MSIGYALSSEEHPPRELVRNAARAEDAGFSFALISDHYHPWTDRQGESPHVWATLGAIAVSTERLQVGTGVTCPIMRQHPAIVAQAAATAGALFEGRFFLGVGTGEYLNEHVFGDRWPTPDERIEMLEEAIDVMRALWTGELTRYFGAYFTIDEARIYTLPPRPVPVLVAAAIERVAALAGESADGIIGTRAEPELLEAFADAGGEGKPRVAQVGVCWAEDEATARRTVHEWWPTAALGGSLSQDLKLPRDFEAATALAREEDVAGSFALGPEPRQHIERITQMVDAGYDHVYVHQIGPDQAGFFDFYERAVLPELRLEPARLSGAATLEEAARREAA